MTVAIKHEYLLRYAHEWEQRWRSAVRAPAPYVGQFEQLCGDGLAQEVSGPPGARYFRLTEAGRIAAEGLP